MIIFTRQTKHTQNVHENVICFFIKKINWYASPTVVEYRKTPQSNQDLPLLYIYIYVCVYTRARALNLLISTKKKTHRSSFHTFGKPADWRGHLY